MDRTMIVRSSHDKRCYCGNCGRMVLQDEYNIRKHVTECKGYDADVDLIRIFTEGKDFGYRLTQTGPHELTIEICEAKLEPIPGFVDRYQGAVWDPKLRVIYRNDGSRKVTEEFNDTTFPYHIWLSLMRQPCTVARIQKEPDLEVIQSAFPDIYDTFSFQMFDYIYWNRGYPQKSEWISEKEKDALLHIRDKTTSLWMVQDNVVLRVEIPSDTLDEGPDVFLFCKNHVICNKHNVDYKKLFYTEFQQEEAACFQYFADCNPDSDLAYYMKDGRQSNFLMPLLAGYYHYGLEMVMKAGLTNLASNLELEYLIKDPTVYHNLKDLFGGGIPISLLRKIDCEKDMVEEVMNLDVFLKIAGYLYARNPAFLQTSWSKTTLRFLKDFYTNVIPGISQLEDQKILKMIRYADTLSYWDYTNYRDYLNMCCQIRSFPDGLAPKDLDQAHDYVMHLYYEMRDEAKNRAFDDRVNSDDYRCLVETDDAEKSAYMILSPHHASDLDTEGSAMHNCVATYKRMVADGTSKIYFLRKTREPDKSFGTIEVQFETLVQAKAFANRRLPVSAQRFVRKWCERNGLKINTCDLAESA